MLGEFKIVNWYSEIEREKRSYQPAIPTSKELWLQSFGAGGLARFNGGTPS